MNVLCTLHVNGTDHTVAVGSSDTLLEVLRERLGLTGTKKGCNVGDCGACTVLVNGEPMNGCLLLAAEMEGKAIVTVEGLENADGTLHPCQQAIVDTHGSQCGFCTPGFVMSLYVMGLGRTKPDRQTINDGFAGNLCRCTGYEDIIRAVEQCLPDIEDKDLTPVEQCLADVEDRDPDTG